MKTVFLDIESAPSTAFVWGLFDDHIPIDRIIDTSKVLCWAARWHGSREMLFASSADGGHKRMLKRMHALLGEADVVVTYNGNRFDIPVLNREFLMHGMTPPSPYKSVDLYQTVRGRFRFLSGKLDHVAQQLGVGEKVRHPGFELWVKCMNGDKQALKHMERYNKQDVVLLEGLYEKMRPWIKGHPNVGAFDPSDLEKCPHCGSKHLQRRGVAVTKDVQYQRWQCLDCGAWSRGKKAMAKSRATLQGIG